MNRVFFLILLYVISLPVFSQKRVITVEDLWDLRRIEHFTLSHDGQWIAYTSTQYQMDRNTKNTDIHLLSSSGGSPRQITTHSAYDGNPCWSPDGSLLSFISNRDGLPQIYTIPMNGGEARKISNIPTGVYDFIWSPDGKYFAFTSEIYPYISNLDLNSHIDQQQDEKIIKAKIFDHLLYRHWNRWLDGKRSHIFVMPATGGKPWDVTPGDFDTPPISLGSHQDFSFSPDGREIAFVRNTDSLVSLSTNNDIFIVPTRGGTIRRVTHNLANDNHPVYSPDGKYIAYRAQMRPGFESDQYDIILYNRTTGSIKNLTNKFDLDIEEIVWGPSSDKIYFSAGDQGRSIIFFVEVKSNKIRGVVHSGCSSNLVVDPEENQIFFIRTYINLPHEIFSCDSKGEECYQMTFTNQTLIDQIEMNSTKDFWFPSFDGRIIHGFLLNPPFFDPANMYPAILLIHGGPLEAWKDEFHYRWNAQMFASRGYVVIMINVRGSKGYGLAFSQAVSKNWGGGPYRDLMIGLEYAVKKYPFIQSKNIAAAGGFYGGYMINWIAGQTDRFRVLVSHNGVFNLASFYGSTDELWFPEWEFDGPYYENDKLYEKWSPIRNAKYFKTPTLVIHGAFDFRVPVEQGIQMFTALQRQRVPSKLLYYPDEGHYILKPQNGRLWWNTVLDWIDQWVKK